MNASKLIAYFVRIMPLTHAEIAAIEASMCIRTYPKGSILLREGQVATESYFVLAGCVRQYTLVEGEERTSRFFMEEQWVLSLESFLQGTPAAHGWVCAEETTVVVGTEQREQELFVRFPRLETVARKVLERVIAEHQSLLAAYVTDTPEQRYRKLLQSCPSLLQRVPQYHIASYIGVKPESLSRIRRRIAREATGLS
jgi:CRP-like cAMP-binding protein